MGKLNAVWNAFCRHKYAVVVILFVLLIGFLDENSLLSRYRHRVELDELHAEIRRYTEMYEHDTRSLQQLDSNPEMLVEVARERYYMQMADEDVFVIQSDKGDEDAE